MAETIMLQATDGTGSFSAYVASPQGEGKAPALILIQEIFGVNANMKAWCDHYAAQGYLAICPDLFWRQEPNVSITDQTEAEWQKAFALFQGFNLDKGVEDLKTTLDVIRTHPRSTGKVGCIGFCLGGRLAVLMAARTNIDASVSYYGVGLDSHIAEFANIQKPLLMHVAALDKYVPVEVREKLIAVTSNLPAITLNIYEGVDHAFARVGGAHYDANAAQLANGRSAEFIKATLTK